MSSKKLGVKKDGKEGEVETNEKRGLPLRALSMLPLEDQINMILGDTSSEQEENVEKKKEEEGKGEIKREGSAPTLVSPLPSRTRSIARREGSRRLEFDVSDENGEVEVDDEGSWVVEDSKQIRARTKSFLASPSSPPPFAQALPSTLLPVEPEYERNSASEGESEVQRGIFQESPSLQAEPLPTASSSSETLPLESSEEASVPKLQLPKLPVLRRKRNFVGLPPLFAEAWGALEELEEQELMADEAKDQKTLKVKRKLALKRKQRRSNLLQGVTLRSIVPPTYRGPKLKIDESVVAIGEGGGGNPTLVLHSVTSAGLLGRSIPLSKPSSVFSSNTIQMSLEKKKEEEEEEREVSPISSPSALATSNPALNLSNQSNQSNPSNQSSKGGSSEQPTFIIPKVASEPYVATHGVTMEFVLQMINAFQDGVDLHYIYAKQIIYHVARYMEHYESTVLDISIPDHGKMVVVGDLHGQMDDLLTILKKGLFPNDLNIYLFNGDLVDRGPHSVQVLLIIYALKLVNPTAVYMNRGNHENRLMNARYGFEMQVKRLYDEDLYELIQTSFNWMPVVTLVEDSTMIVHGGLAQFETLALDEIRSIPRRDLLPHPLVNTREDLILEQLLWSDPGKGGKGWLHNRRGAGILFSSDLTKAFMAKNNLHLIIRSHQMVDKGFIRCHEGKIVTIFSASHYCASNTNLGAIGILDSDSGKLNFIQYEAEQGLMAFSQSLSTKKGQVQPMMVGGTTQREESLDQKNSDQKSSEKNSETQKSSSDKLSSHSSPSLETSASSFPASTPRQLSVEEKQRDGTLQKLHERILRKRHSLYLSFAQLDKKTGFVTLDDWASVMTMIIKIDLHWQALWPFLGYASDDAYAYGHITPSQSSSSSSNIIISSKSKDSSRTASPLRSDSPSSSKSSSSSKTKLSKSGGLQVSGGRAEGGNLSSALPEFVNYTRFLDLYTTIVDPEMADVLKRRQAQLVSKLCRKFYERSLDLKQVFSSMDKDGDGLISYEEFCAGLRRYKKQLGLDGGQLYDLMRSVQLVHIRDPSNAPGDGQRTKDLDLSEGGGKESSKSKLDANLPSSTPYYHPTGLVRFKDFLDRFSVQFEAISEVPEAQKTLLLETLNELANLIYRKRGSSDSAKMKRMYRSFLFPPAGATGSPSNNLNGGSSSRRTSAASSNSPSTKSGVKVSSPTATSHRGGSTESDTENPIVPSSSRLHASTTSPPIITEVNLRSSSFSTPNTTGQTPTGTSRLHSTSTPSHPTGLPSNISASSRRHYIASDESDTTTDDENEQKTENIESEGPTSPIRGSSSYNDVTSPLSSSGRMASTEELDEGREDEANLNADSPTSPGSPSSTTSPSLLRNRSSSLGYPKRTKNQGVTPKQETLLGDVPPAPETANPEPTSPTSANKLVQSPSQALSRSSPKLNLKKSENNVSPSGMQTSPSASSQSKRTKSSGPPKVSMEERGRESIGSTWTDISSSSLDSARSESLKYASLGFKEFYAGIQRELGHLNLTKKQVRIIFNYMDRNGDGQLSYFEFRRCFKFGDSQSDAWAGAAIAAEIQNNRNKLLKVFVEMDVEGSGKVPLGDFKTVFNTLLGKALEEEETRLFGTSGQTLMSSSSSVSSSSHPSHHHPASISPPPHQNPSPSDTIDYNRFLKSFRAGKKNS